MVDNATWLKVSNPQAMARLGHVRHVLFDFDGTISVLRQGWEKVMFPVMVEAICGKTTANAEIEQEVSDYIDRSTGILTILQMQWLVEAVHRHGLVSEERSAADYKAMYLKRLMQSVDLRIGKVTEGVIPTSDCLVAGAENFLQGLARRGVRLYAASGTDHADVVHEATLLGVADYFDGGIYGALDEIEAHSKERIIQRILDDNQLSGDGLLVVGDGPVELREAHARQALALGVASDEVARQGWNTLKVPRLANAMADLLVADFCEASQLIALFLDGVIPAGLDH